MRVSCDFDGAWKGVFDTLYGPNVLEHCPDELKHEEPVVSASKRADAVIIVVPQHPLFLARWTKRWNIASDMFAEGLKQSLELEAFMLKKFRLQPLCRSGWLVKRQALRRTKFLVFS